MQKLCNLCRVSKKEKILLSWSGGRDSALSLFEVKSPDFKLNGLITTIVEGDQVVQAHGIKQSLVLKQAESLEVPILFVPVPKNASNEIYESRMKEILNPLHRKGLEGIAFGDLHLEDVRAYREKFLSSIGMKAHFPLWKWGSKEILRVFFSLGFKAIVTVVDLKKLPLPFVGREFDMDFVEDLPSGIDPCGENGEFHTFVYDGPFFQRRIDFSKGKVVEVDGFGYQELIG